MNFSYFPSLTNSYQSSYINSSHHSLELTVRAAQHKDTNSLAEILTKSFHPPQGLVYWFYPVLKLGIAEDIRSRLRANSPHHICLVASKNLVNKAETIVGTVEISLRYSYSWSNLGKQYPYIANLAVKNEYRRQGIAHKLLLKCEQIAFEWGCQEIFLHVLESNYQAYQLYLKHGYKMQRAESSLSDLLLQRPRKLLLTKSLDFSQKPTLEN